jgi:hypothetical protein
MMKENISKKNFGDKEDTAKAWRTAKVILGMNKNLQPTSIKTKGDNGEIELVTNPMKLADMFNKYFKSRVDKSRRAPRKMASTER